MDSDIDELSAPKAVPNTVSSRKIQIEKEIDQINNEIVNINAIIKELYISDKNKNRIKSYNKLLENLLEDIQDFKEEIETIDGINNPNKINIYTLCTQAGKTSLILEKLNYYFKNNINVVFISPNKTSLQQQTFSRIFERYGFCPKRTDSRAKSADRFSVFKTQEDLSCIMCLNNKANLATLCEYMIHELPKNKKFHLVFDEIHQIVPKKNSDNFANYILNMMNDDTPVTKNYLKMKEHSSDMLTYLLFMLYNKYNKNISIVGVTATAFSIIDIPLIDKLKNDGIEFYTKQCELPQCYVGYEKSTKSIIPTPNHGEDILTSAFNSIISQDRKSFIVMCHVGRYKAQHISARNQFVEACSDAGLDYCSIIHNGDGFTIMGSRHTEHVVSIRRVNVSSQILVRCAKMYGYNYIGFFGDICMNMGNTYNDPSQGIFLTDMIVLKVDKVKANSRKASDLIQKIGRASFNDINGVSPNVTIWFPSQEEKERFDLFYKAEITCQEECQTTAFADADPKEIIRRSKVPKVQHGGEDGTEENTAEIEGLRKLFQIWARPSTKTKISKLMKEIDPLKVYTRKEFMQFAVSCGFKDDVNIISNMTVKNGNHTYGKIISINGNEVKLRNELVDMYNKYFKKN